MKEETDSTYDKSLEGGMTYRIIGKHELSIPRSVVKSIRRKEKYYSTEDVSDIIANYEKLSSTRHLPLLAWLWILKIAPSFRKAVKTWKLSLEDLTLYRDLSMVEKISWIPKTNFNYATIGSVYLTNFQFFKRELFEAVEFDVTDIKRYSIRGNFVYKNNPPCEDDAVSQRQINDVLSANGTTTFDLTYQAMDENYKIKHKNTYSHRGKKIFVLDISRSEPDDDEEVTPSDYFISRPRGLLI
jgi:hypothetical protein